MAPKKPKKENQVSKALDHKTAQKKSFFKSSPRTNSIVSEKDVKTRGSLLWIAFLTPAILLPLFFRGAFFPREQHMAQIAVMLLFIVWMFQDTLQGNRLTIAAQPWPLILGLFVVAYTLPVITFQWASLDQAIGKIIWYIALLLLYWLVREKIYEKHQTGLFLDLWIIAGLILAAIGLASLAGYGDLTEAVLGNTRIASTFQYPNTLAAFLMGLFFISCGRFMAADSLKQKIFYAGSGWWMILVFILTYSRAAWLIFPLMAVGYWLLIPRRDKLPLLFYYTITTVTLLIALQPIVRLTPGADQTEPLLLITAVGGLVAAMVLFGIIQKAVDALRDRYEKAAYGAFALAAVLGIGFMVLAYNATEPLHFENTGEEPRTQSIRRTVEGVYPGEYQLALQVESQGGSEDEWPWLVQVVAVREEGNQQVMQHAAQPGESGSFLFDFTMPEETAGLIVVFQNRFPETGVTFAQASINALEGDWEHEIPLAYKYIPEALAARFEAIDLETSSASIRVTFYRDGLAMFRDRPLTGAGGGAWEQQYRQFQSEPYTSRNPHTFFLQTLVETGIVGLLTMAAMMGALLLGLYQTFRAGNCLGISLYIALLAAMAHSALDFNFEYFSIAMFFWVLSALLPPMEEASVPGTLLAKTNQRKLTALVMLFLVLPVLLVTGLRYSAMNQGAAASAAAAQGDIETTYYYLDGAIGRNPFHPLYRSDMVQLLTVAVQQGGQSDLLDEAAVHLERGIRYAPHHDSLMRQGISLYGSLADTAKVLELAEARASRMPLFINMYENNIQTLNGYARSWLVDNNQGEAKRIIEWNLTHVDRLLAANEQAARPANITNNFRTAIMETRALHQALQDGVPSEAIRNGFTYAAFPTLEFTLGSERIWRTWNREDGKLETALTADGLVVTNAGDDLGFAYTPNMPLEPEITYQVRILFTEISLEKPMRILVIANDSEDNRSQHSHTHDSGTIGLTAAFTFTTTGDIEPGNQYIRWDHAGNDLGSFTISGIYVYPSE